MTRITRPRIDVEAVALWPGAGSSSEHPSLLAIEQELAPLPVARFDFDYRREGRRAPDRANRCIATLRRQVSALCEELGTTSDRVVLGGRSMGGRIASMAAAGATGETRKDAPRWQEPLAAAGLVLISYPLHPPGKPEKLRTDHLDRIDVPTLFVSGDRDPFGSPEELARAQDLIDADVTSVTLEGRRHELSGADAEVAAVIAAWLTG